MATPPPRLASPDSTIPLLLEGYRFFPRRCRRFHSDLFSGRLLGETTYFMTGPDAAALFYDDSRFRRADAAPPLLRRTLFGKGAVHWLDGEQHRARKAMFLCLMSKASIEQLLDLVEVEWDAAAQYWQRCEEVRLIPETRKFLCRAACDWSGVPMVDADIADLALDCAAMIDGFSRIGRPTLRALRARVRAELWARRVIRAIRRGNLDAKPGGAAHVIATYLQPDDSPLDEKVAAVELLNVIRPIANISIWIGFVALALRDHPEYLEPLRTGEELVEPFVHEVRRFYPFAPFIAARVRQTFEWRGTSFPEGRLVVLDVHGTLRNPRLWNAPELFRPERFVSRRPTPFDLIPQGGGDFAGGHRCAGEWLTIETMKQAVRFLSRHLEYELPAQDLGYSLSIMPTGPRSDVLLRSVRRRLAPDLQITPFSFRAGDGLGASVAHHR